MNIISQAGKDLHLLEIYVWEKDESLFTHIDQIE